MTTTTSTSLVVNPAFYLQGGLYNGPPAVVTGPVVGVWTITVPDEDATVEELDIAVELEVAALLASTILSDLMAKGVAAQVVNATFLAIVTPTQAQSLAQIRSLTKQCNALIKLASADLNDTTGT